MQAGRVDGARAHGVDARLLLDSRVVDLSIAYNPTLVILSPFKPLFFNSLRNDLRSLDNVGAQDPGIQ